MKVDLRNLNFLLNFLQVLALVFGICNQKNNSAQVNWTISEPKVDAPSSVWTTNFIQQPLAPNVISISGFPVTLSNTEILKVQWSALYPFEVIFEETLNPDIDNPDGRATHTEQDVSEDSENSKNFVFTISLQYRLGLLVSLKQSRLYVRSVENPCIGKIEHLAFHPENETITITTEEIDPNLNNDLEKNVPANINTHVNSSSNNSDSPESLCKATFHYVAPVRSAANRYPPYTIACTFPDGTPGKIQLPKIPQSSVIRNSFRQIDVQPSKCWKEFIPSKNAAESHKNNSACPNCNFTALETRDAIVPICVHSNKTVENNRPLKIGSFAVFGVVNGYNWQSQIVLPGQHPTRESLVRLNLSSEHYQVMNTSVRLFCVFSKYFISPPFRVMVEYENDDKLDNGTPPTRLEITPANFYRTFDWGDFYAPLQLHVDSPKMKRVYCSGLLHDREEWVNYSKPLLILTPLKPTTLTSIKDTGGSKKSGKDSVEMDECESKQKCAVKVYLKSGEDKKNLTCKVGGRPTPKIQWTRLNNTVTESASGYVWNETSIDNSYAWSEIQIKNVTAASGGVYTCKAVNEFGTYEKSFHVIVDDTSFPILVVILSTVFGAILLFCGLFLAFQLRKLKMQQRIIRSLTEEEIQEFFEGDQKLKPEDPHFNVFSKGFDSVYEISKDQLVVDETKPLGSGQFGTVTLGYMYMNAQLPTGESRANECHYTRCEAEEEARIQESAYVNPRITVAIKTVKSNVDMIHVKSLLSEIKIMAFLGTHPNVIQLMGVVTADIKDGRILVAVEYCPNGDLLNFLKKRRGQFQNIFQQQKTQLAEFVNQRLSNVGEACKIAHRQLEQKKLNEEGANENYTTLDLLGWSAEIANGMVYLSDKRIIHGDLAARNILLTERKVAKISDFGLSRQLLNDYSIYSKKSATPLPWKWLAYESLRNNDFSVRSDVWALGVVLWEIFSLAESPYPGCRYNEEFLDRIEAGFRLRQPDFANDKLYNLMTHCWAKEPENRPDAQTIYDQINKILSQVLQSTSLDRLEDDKVN